MSSTTFDPNNYTEHLFNRNGSLADEKVFDYDEFMKGLDEEIKALKKTLSHISNEKMLKILKDNLYEAEAVKRVMDEIEKEDIIYEE